MGVARPRGSQVGDPSRLAALDRTGLLNSGPEESFERLGALAKRLTGASAALVSLVAADKQHFKCCLGLPEPWNQANETPLSHSICQFVLDSHEPLVISNTATDSRLIDNGAVTELAAAAYLGIPLLGPGGEILGSFCVIDTSPREWTEENISVMADLAASVMAEIELREVLHERRDHTALLARSESRLRSMMDGLSIFAGFLDTDGTVLEANSALLDSAGLKREDVLGARFWDCYWWSWSSSVQEQIHAAVRHAADGNLCRFDTELRLSADRVVTVDFQLAPVTEDGEVVRLIPSALDITARKHSERELQQMAFIEARHRRRAEDLLALTRSLSSAANVDEVGDAVVSFGARIVDAGTCSLGVTEDETVLNVRSNGGLDPAEPSRWAATTCDGSTPLSAAVVDAEPKLLTDLDQIRVRFPAVTCEFETVGLRSAAAIPIPQGGAAVGFAWSDDTTFDHTTVDTLELIAELVGNALQRAADQERDRRVAQRLQRSLLPVELPTIPGVTLAARYEAGGSGLDIGGDWYDVAALDRDRWVLAVGDVVGRGLNAATVMGRLRTAFAVTAHNTAHLGRLVDRFDNVASDMGSGRFSTMVAAEFVPETGSLSAVLAGHPPAFIRRRGGTIERLGGSGRPIGIVHGEDRVVVTSTLSAGDALLLYTDGLIERRSEPIDEGLKRLEVALAGVDPTDGNAACDRILSAMAPDDEDDVALLLMTVNQPKS